MASHLPSVPLASLGEMLSPNTLCGNTKIWEEKIIEKKTVKQGAISKRSCFGRGILLTKTSRPPPWTGAIPTIPKNTSTTRLRRYITNFNNLKICRKVKEISRIPAAYFSTDFTPQFTPQITPQFLAEKFSSTI